MKKSGFILVAIVLALPGFAQTASDKFNTDHYQAIIQGLGGECFSYTHSEPPNVNTIEVEAGKSLQYAEKSNPAGTSVIFLHVLTDSWHSFENTLLLLPEDIYAFTITQRGYGGSDKTFTKK